MPQLRRNTPVILVTLLLICTGILPAFKTGFAPPPLNDNCSLADPITISGGGFDYNTYSSSVSDLTMATGEPGEFFEFATEYGHRKSVWFEFDLVTSRSVRIKLEAAPGSVLPDPKHSGVTLYSPTGCLPGGGNRLGSIISSGELERYCTTPGTYRIQVTGVDNISASVFVNLTLGCPFDPIYPDVSTYDCPDKAFVFNSGNPLPSSSGTGVHTIECHSIEDPSEYACLPLPNKSDYLKSAWYVFTTGSMVDLLAFDFPVSSQTTEVGYTLLQGNVRNFPFSSLPQIECGLAEISFNTRFIEFHCVLLPNTTYTLEIIFHKDFEYSNFNIRALQRGMSATGWPKPTLPPVVATNQLGVLPTQLSWNDRFDCSSYISKNVCPPANPASGLVVMGSGNLARSYDLATWATFTLSNDANVDFRFSLYHSNAKYHTRIFAKTLNNNCPSPDPGIDLYYEFSGFSGEIKCLPAGDYSIQVLASSNDTFPSTINHKDSWTNGYLGTRFTMEFEVVYHPSIGLFRLEAPGVFNDINNLNPLQNNVWYPSDSAVFICENTVLPANLSCLDVDKAIYREINIDDADNDGIPDQGLLSITGMLTDLYPDTAIFYQFFKGDANQLATAAGTHAPGQSIPGLTDYAGFCITQEDWPLDPPPGIDVFCACVTPGIYTLTSLGNVDDVGRGDAPVFKFNKYKTIHDSRPNAELITLGPVPGAYYSDPDVFSCDDNPGPLPFCGDGRKLIYREFYLPDSAVMTITEIGSAANVISLFSGRASDLAANLTLLEDCFGTMLFVDWCTKYPPGWYTIVSYGSGPNYTDRKVLAPIGYSGDVGQTSQIRITLDSVVTPNYNRPWKAFQAGVTDWITPPPADPNATTGLIYFFPPDTFCLPDTPFIPNNLAACSLGYNRIAFYVFEITKPSFVQIRYVNQTFYTELYPFDVNAEPGSLLTVPPVYPCISTGSNYRQICDLPPGKYTIAIFANDDHWGLSVRPAIYVDEAALSRFDHVWNAYDFDHIPLTNLFVNGRALDTHPTLAGQAPSRDVFYCTTGATAIDPTHTRCLVQLNSNIYAQPAGVPKPQFLQGNPLPPLDQPWRNLWYTFRLSGSGICTVKTNVLGGVEDPPLIAVYESDADGTIPWTTLQASLINPGNSIIPGLRLLDEDVDFYCDAETSELVFTKSGCLRDSVRYYVLATFDADRVANLPNMPNQVISTSVKYFGKPTFAALYDEWPTANVVNGLIETVPPYTTVPLDINNTFVSTDFSLLCYTRNVTDPPGCNGSGKSAWFKFEVASSGHLYTSLEEVGLGSWYAGTQDMSIWRETVPGGPLTEQLPLSFIPHPGHEWLEGCIDPGTYYLLVRNCSILMDTIQAYRVVLNLIDPPGDFCLNAIPLNVNDFNPVSNNATVDCHTIGTDVGEFAPAGNTCFSIAGKKTTWFHAVVNAGPMVDLKFQLGENFTGSIIDLGDVEYRILAGTCGAMTPIACSAGNINLTLNCLGPGDYYVQVSMPVVAGANSLDVAGTLSLTVTATASDPQFCSDPIDPNEVIADLTYTSGCESITFFNLSTVGTDISYLWEFPDGTSTLVNPTWTPPPGTTSFPVTLTVTNNVSNLSSTITIQVIVSPPFASYSPMPDTVLCNSGTVILDASMVGATYLWDDNSTNPQRITNTDGMFWVIINIDGCEKRDTAVVTSVDAQRTISPTLCPGSSITVGTQLFDNNNPAGTVILPNADISGCDSILTVNLNFYSPANSQHSNTICEGEVFVFGNQNLTQSGLYTDTLSSAHGCDSISMLTLSVTPRQTHNHDVGGCIGASLSLTPSVSGHTYTWSNGSVTDTIDVNAAGTFAVTVSDVDGCIISEETFSVTFGLLSSPNVSVPDPVCNGEDVVLNATGSSGFYQWFDAAVGGTLLGTGSTLLMNNVQNNTIVYVEALQVGTDTCISLREPVQILLSIEPVQNENIDTIICAGSPVTLPWGEVVMPDLDASFSNSWQYAVSGCDSLIFTVNVDIVAIQPLSLPSVLELQLGDSVLLVPQIDFVPDSIAWSPSDGLSCTNCLQPWAYPTQSTDYLLSIWSPEGCLVTALVHLDVNREVRIYIPNVFTPNDDGVNDIFTVYANREVRTVLNLRVFDRWGNGLWQDGNFTPDGTRGWDGLSRGKKMLPGVYVWVCEIELIDGAKEVRSGDVTLVR